MANFSAFHWSEKARKYAERIGTVFNLKGRVDTVEDLPQEDNKIGDMYLVGLASAEDLIEYVWIEIDGQKKWERLGYAHVNLAFSSLTGSPEDNEALKNALDQKEPLLGFVPYAASNPAGFRTESQVNTAIANYHDSSKQDSLTQGEGITLQGSTISVSKALRDQVQQNKEDIADIRLFKFPNAIIIGEPSINNGQISDFSTVSYLQFPFVFDFQDKAFQVDFCFTTAQNVQTQQNILDSNFGLALAIQNGRGVMAISSNGTSWDIGSATGSIAIQSNTTYYARLLWNKLQYKTLLSTDGINYTQDMVITAAVRPYPTTIFIGGCSQAETGHTPHPFLGSINLNKAFLYVNNQLIWQGMDDAGLATRADVSLDNLDAVGQAKFDAKQDVITDLGTIRTNSSNAATHISNTTIHVTAADKVAWSNKQNAITATAKLSADLITDGTTNKTVSSAEKESWNAKQDALGFTPYNATNPAGYQTSSQVSAAISNYHDSSKQDAITESAKLSASLVQDTSTRRFVSDTEKSAWNAKQDALGFVPYNSTNPAGYITSSALTRYATQTWVGQQGFLKSITSSNVTTALGYTPYNSSNPAGYITSSYHDSTKQDNLVSGTNIKTVNGNSILGSGDLTVAADMANSVKDQNHTTVGIKTWTGTLAEYEALKPSKLYCFYSDIWDLYAYTKTLDLYAGQTIYDEAGGIIGTIGTVVDNTSFRPSSSSKFLYERDESGDIPGSEGSIDANTLYNITDDNTALAYEAYSKSETNTLLIEKANTNLSNTTGVDYVVDWKAPTSSDPSWYRVYKSGWVEQGGSVTSSSSQSSPWEPVVSFPKTMSNTNYSLTYGVCGNKGATAHGYHSVKTFSESSATFRIVSASGNFQQNSTIWYKISGQGV